MPRNVLLTFVGATPYKKCLYYLDEQRISGEVRFVQEALGQLVCRSWGPEDTIYVFLTTEAQEQNWEGAEGLAQKLRNLQLACRVEPVDKLTTGFTEQDIWTNFQRIFNCLEEGDKVWLDITNAFRSIPLFTSVLVHYARFLKNIDLQAVYYGAFDVLGPAYNIDERMPNVQDRRVPLLNLVNVIALQHWTSAANDFLHHGNAKELSRLAAQAGFADLAQSLESVTLAFAVSRGREIMRGEIFKNLQEDISQSQGQLERIAPMQPLLEHVKSAFANFADDSVLNGIAAARWCLEHKLIQQGITILRETIISMVCRQSSLNESEYSNNRRHVEVAFGCYGRDMEDWLTKGVPHERINTLMDVRVFQLLANVYQKLNHGYRNDINHGGFLDWAKPAPDFERILNESLSEIERLITNNPAV
jgi:CRISPR-associated Csx2 family protein